MILFIGHLISEGKKSTTIRSYVSAIKAILQVEGFKIQEDTYLLNALTKACKLHDDIVMTRLPIRLGMLRVILKIVGQEYDTQPYLRSLYQALFSTAYFGLFRIGEITQSPHVIKACDVHLAKNKKKVMFVLRSSKTHTPRQTSHK